MIHMPMFSIFILLFINLNVLLHFKLEWSLFIFWELKKNGLSGWALSQTQMDTGRTRASGVSGSPSKRTKMDTFCVLFGWQRWIRPKPQSSNPYQFCSNLEEKQQNLILCFHFHRAMELQMNRFPPHYPTPTLVLIWCFFRAFSTLMDY